ncbi:MAG: alpha/beta hydrolase [Candidatus Dojkabacteria bacterium]|nr:alpha/beta hydrolase [Candidatus Dojkabacteria bacterium]MDQ7020287.1 alpha/beta hydrolase [Candidatus Dojkabacteria bacterium]
MRGKEIIKQNDLVYALRATSKDANASDEFKSSLLNKLNLELNSKGAVKVNELEISLEGFKKVKYYKAGNSEEVLLFIHGIGTIDKLYTKFINYFSKKYTVIAPALPGYGTSLEDWFKTNNYSKALDSYALFVEKFVKSLNLDKPITLVGHSFGGAVAIRYAKKNENQKLIKKLVLADTEKIPVDMSLKSFIYGSFKAQLSYLRRLKVKNISILNFFIKNIRNLVDTYKIAFNINLEKEIEGLRSDTKFYLNDENEITPLKKIKEVKDIIKNVSVSVVNYPEESWFYDSPEKIKLS